MVQLVEDVEIVCFDLETTGFLMSDQIIQIAASTQHSSFNVYITPTKPIHWKASEVTGLKLFQNKLFLHGNPVRSISAKKAFKNFMDYLKNINKNLILVAHNCFGFDMPRIIKLADELGFLNQFKKVVKGFSDSLVILRSILKDQRVGKGKFTLKALVQDFVSRDFTKDFHNAKSDVASLQLLLFHSGLGVSKELISQSSKSFHQYFNEQEIKRLVREAKLSLQDYKDILSVWVINKMAKARIGKNLLKEVYNKDGFEGIKKLCSKNCYGRPRVTRNVKIINKICNAIKNDVYL